VPQSRSARGGGSVAGFKILAIYS